MEQKRTFYTADLYFTDGGTETVTRDTLNQIESAIEYTKKMLSTLYCAEIYECVTTAKKTKIINL